jgi:2-hydroxychromene-2-carboxylate isomerase
MSFVVDLFFSFRSPYSYLALTKTRRMVDMYDVVVRLRPVYQIAVRIPNFFKNAKPEFRQVRSSRQREGRAP